MIVHLPNTGSATGLQNNTGISGIRSVEGVGGESGARGTESAR